MMNIESLRKISDIGDVVMSIVISILVLIHSITLLVQSKPSDYQDITIGVIYLVLSIMLMMMIACTFVLKMCIAKQKNIRHID